MKNEQKRELRRKQVNFEALFCRLNRSVAIRSLWPEAFAATGLTESIEYLPSGEKVYVLRRDDGMFRKFLAHRTSLSRSIESA